MDLGSTIVAVDWERLAPQQRERPLVFVLTRTLPHFRRPIFERLSQQPDFDIVFLHSTEINAGDTGIAAPALDRSFPVETSQVGRQPLAVVVQWESLRRVRTFNPDVILCEGTINFLTVYLAAWRQWWRGQGVIYWAKGATPKARGGLVGALREFVYWISTRPATLCVGYGETSRPYFRSLGFDDERIVVAQNAVDTSMILADPDGWAEQGRTFRSEMNVAPGATILAVVSRLIGRKRIDLLIEAAGQLAERHGPIVVAIGGTGPAEEELRAQAAGFGDKLDVRFLGKLPIGDDNRLYAAADINVFPGAVGLAIVQSMALARPTVCADEPFADAELVEHERTGLRFERGSATALAEQLERLIKDPALGGELGRQGREHIRTRATIDNMVNQLAEAIRRGLRLRRRARGQSK